MNHTCATCIFLSNIRLGAAIKCLVGGKFTVESAPACEDHEPPGRDSLTKLGRMMREKESR